MERGEGRVTSSFDVTAINLVSAQVLSYLNYPSNFLVTENETKQN